MWGKVGGLLQNNLLLAPAQEEEALGLVPWEGAGVGFGLIPGEGLQGQLGLPSGSSLRT